MTTDRRRARQRTEIVELVEAGQRARAHALAREHVLLFPDDEALFSALFDNSDESAANG